MDLKVLKNKNYALVVLGRFVSDFGTFLQSFALSLFVLDKTGSPTLFASVIAVSMIPRIALMPFAGVLADRFSRKKMIVRMDALSGIFVLAMVVIYLFTNDLSLAMIYVTVIVLNTISVFFAPAMQSIMPDIIEKEKLPDANSLMEMGGAIIAVSVPVTAGLLYSTFGILSIMIVNGVSFLLSSLSESFIKIDKESLISKDNRDSFFVSFKEGLLYLKSMPEFLIVIAITVVANFALGPIFSIALPIVVLNDFGMSETAYGVMTSLTTIGMFVGPIFAAGIIKKYHYSKLVSAILSIGGVLCLLVAISSIPSLFPSVMYNSAIIIVLINILMVTIIWVNLSMTTARQRIVPGHLQGRVTSVSGTFSMLAMPAGQMIMGILLDSSKSYIIIGMYAVIVIFSGIIAKIGFSKLQNSGKMDVTLGIENTKPEGVPLPENA